MYPRKYGLEETIATFIGTFCVSMKFGGWIGMAFASALYVLAPYWRSHTINREVSGG